MSSTPVLRHTRLLKTGVRAGSRARIRSRCPVGMLRQAARQRDRCGAPAQAAELLDRIGATRVDTAIAEKRWFYGDAS